MLFVIRQLDYGGTERQLVELATRLPRERFDVCVCCLCPPGPLAKELEQSGIRVVSTYKKLGADYFERINEQAVIRRLTTRIRNLGYDVELTKTKAAA